MFLLVQFSAMEIMAETECFGIGVYNTTSVSGNCYIFSMFPRKIPFLISIHCERQGIVPPAVWEHFKSLREHSSDPIDVLMCSYPSEIALVISDNFHYPLNGNLPQEIILFVDSFHEKELSF